MRIILAAFLAAASIVPTVAQADLLERQTARYIRNAGYTCDRVSDMRIVKGRSNQFQRVVLVTCADGYGHASYELIVDENERIKQIKRL